MVNRGTRRNVETRNLQRRRAFFRWSVLPPDAHRFGVVRAGHRDRGRGVGRGVAERLAGRVPVPFPPQHLEARQAEPGERLPHVVRHGAEIFRDDALPGAAEDLHQPLALGDLPRGVGGRKNGVPSRGIAYVR